MQEQKTVITIYIKKRIIYIGTFPSINKQTILFLAERPGTELKEGSQWAQAKVRTHQKGEQEQPAGQGLAAAAQDQNKQCKFIINKD